MEVRDMPELRTGPAAGLDPAEDPEALSRALAEAPRGALALAALTVGLLILGWFFVYLFVFLPRGMVG
jgi:hypothetical protein